MLDPEARKCTHHTHKKSYAMKVKCPSFHCPDSFSISLSLCHSTQLSPCLHLSTSPTLQSRLLNLIPTSLLTYFVAKDLLLNSSNCHPPPPWFLHLRLLLYDCYSHILLPPSSAIQGLNWGSHIIVFKLACLAPCYRTSAHPPWLLHHCSHPLSAPLLGVNTQLP